MRPRDEQHIGPMRGERPPADGPGNHAREIEHTHARERSALGMCGQWLRWRIADALDCHQRLAGDGDALRVRVPLFKRTRRGDDHARLRRRVFKRFGLPLAQCSGHGVAVIRAAEQLEHAVTVMWEVGMQAHAAPVAAAVEPGDLVPWLGRQLAVDAEVALGAELQRGVVHVDRHRLLAPGAQRIDVRGGQGGGRDGALRERADRKG